MRQNQQTGFSIIEILVTMGIATILITSIMSITAMILDRMSHLEKKNDILDLTTELRTLAGNVNTCTCHFEGHDFDSTISNSSVVIPVLRSGCTTTSPVIAKSGEKIQNSKKGLIVDKVSLENLQYTGNGALYSANLTVSFQESSGSMSFKPASISTVVTVEQSTIATPATKILGCSNSNMLPNQAVPSTLLYNLHQGATDCKKIQAVYNGQPYGDTLKTLAYNSACKRWCTGCTKNLGGNVGGECIIDWPGMGYSTGFFQDCDFSTDVAYCTCFK